MLSDTTESNSHRKKPSLQPTTSSALSRFRKTHLKRCDVVMCLLGYPFHHLGMYCFGVGQTAKRVHLGQDELLTIVEICQVAMPLVIRPQQHGESTVIASSTDHLHDLMNLQTLFYEIAHFFSVRLSSGWVCRKAR